jgi:hypothetical protein
MKRGGRPFPSCFSGVTVQKPPLSLILLSVIAILLMAWSVVNSLHILWFGSYLDVGDVQLLWFHSPENEKISPLSLPVDPGKVAWPFLVFGLTWPGVLAALWLGMPWGSRCVVGLFVLSLSILGLGTLLSLLGLMCHTTATTRRWITQFGEAHGV